MRSDFEKEQNPLFTSQKTITMNKKQLLQQFPELIREIYNEINRMPLEAKADGRLDKYISEQKKDYKPDPKEVYKRLCNIIDSWKTWVSTPIPSELLKERDELAEKLGKKEWEILSLTKTKGCIYCPPDEETKQKLFDQGFVIHSVRYKDEVYTVGDKAETEYCKGTVFTISGFDIIESKCRVNFKKDTSNLLAIGIDSIKKPKTPIFTTNGDNEPLFYNDFYYFVPSEIPNKVFESILKNKVYCPPSDQTTFKDKTKAEDYLIDNYKGLTFNDIIESDIINKPLTALSKLKSIVKERLGK